MANLNDYQSEEEVPRTTDAAVRYPQFSKQQLAEIEAGNKRQSLPARDAPIGADEANTPLDIVNIDQLREWVSEQPDQFLREFDTLRRERDRAFQILQEAKGDLSHPPDSMTDVAIKYQEKYRKERIDKAKRDETIEELRHEVQVLKDRSVTDNRQTTPALSVISNRQERSSKIPDPPALNNAITPTWHEWLCAIREKLETNADHFANEKARINYVCSRTAGDAALVLTARRRPNTDYPFQLHQEVIDDLAEIYEDVYEVKTANREYKRLQQGSKTFVKFYSELRRVAGVCGITEKTILQDLDDKIRPELKEKWNTSAGELKTLREVKDYLIKVDNYYREAKEDQKGKNTYTKTAFSSSSQAYKPPQRRDPPPERNISKDVCKLCKKTGHWAGSCPKQESKKDKYVQRRKELNIQTITPLSDTSSSSSSESEHSENE